MHVCFIAYFYSKISTISLYRNVTRRVSSSFNQKRNLKRVSSITNLQIKDKIVFQYEARNITLKYQKRGIKFYRVPQQRAVTQSRRSDVDPSRRFRNSGGSVRMQRTAPSNCKGLGCANLLQRPTRYVTVVMTFINNVSPENGR